MKKTKFTELQIVFALKQTDTRTRVDEVCRKMGISEAIFYNWKKRYVGLGINELRLQHSRLPYLNNTCLNKVDNLIYCFLKNWCSVCFDRIYFSKDKRNSRLILYTNAKGFFCITLERPPPQVLST